MEQQKTNALAHDDLVAYLDPSISQTDDFYAHVNKRWCDTNPIPAKESVWSAFSVLREEAKEKLHAILLDIAGENELPEGSNKQKIRDLYRVGMDEARLAREWLAPVRDMLTRIQNIAMPLDVITVAAQLRGNGAAPFWEHFVKVDAKQSTVNRLYFEQAGLSLPDRDYYLKDDAKFAHIRAEFVTYMANIFRLIGDTAEAAAGKAESVFQIEMRLAKASLSAVERRDEEKQYHRKTVAELSVFAPDIRWREYLEHLGVSEEPAYTIVRQPAFIEECDRLLREAGEDANALARLKAYLEWHCLNNAAPLLSRSFSDLQFGFYGTVISGTTEERPRWERVLAAAENVLGFALGELYVERHFPPEAKARVEALAKDLHAVLGDRIKKLPWMGEETKQRALANLARFTYKLGYPDVWRDYSHFRVSARDSYAENCFRGRMVECERKLRQIDKPVDRTEWFMLPHTVNAYCDQQRKEIAFPAGILQPPFFDFRVDDAVNFGGIGMVIGHEFTHGFDDQGSKFDEEGNLSDWWTAEDRKRFMEKAAVLVAQFGACTVLGLPVNGELTLGENIADLGGVAIAFEALQRALARKGRPEAIEGLTPEQRFFLSYARVWRGNIRDELARQYLTIDPHSPKHLRVNIPLSNTPAFYDAFGCKEGCAMYLPESKRVEIW